MPRLKNRTSTIIRILVVRAVYLFARTDEKIIKNVKILEPNGYARKLAIGIGVKEHYRKLRRHLSMRHFDTNNTRHLSDINTSYLLSGLAPQLLEQFDEWRDVIDVLVTAGVHVHLAT